MGAFIVDETAGYYRVKSDLTQLIPVTRDWATNPLILDVQIPLAYRYPYGNKAFFVDIGQNARNVGYPYKQWDGSPLPLNINLVACSDGIHPDATSINTAVARVFTYKLSDISATYTNLEESVIIPADYHWTGNGFDNKLSLNKDDYADWLVVDGIEWYDNSDNGNYDDFNKREYLSHNHTYDVLLPIELTKYRSINGLPDNFRDYEPNGLMMLSLTGSLLYRNTEYQDRVTAQPFFTTATGEPWVALGKNVNLYNESNGYKTGLHLTIVPNTDSLKKYFDMWGVPVFFDDRVESTNVDEPGVPDNPTDPDNPGSGDNNVDPMNVEIPSISPVSAVTMQYAATAQEIGKLIDWLMTDDFLTNISKFFNEPTEYLIGCKYYPFDLALHHPLGVGTAGAYRVGNMNTPLGVTAAPIYSDFNRKLGECSFLVEPYYGNFLDYSPYTKYELYLPYIGYRTINSNDIVNRTLKVAYYTDLTEGRVLAQVWADTTMLESYEGQLAYDIPLSSSDGRERAVKTIQMAANALGTIGGAAYGGAVFGTSKRVANRAAKAAVGGAISAAPDIISQVTSMAPQIDKGGAVSSDINGFNPQDVYLIMTRPIMAQPQNFAQVQGYAASYGGTVSEFSGYLQCREILGGTGATATENDMINELLRGGIHID